MIMASLTSTALPPFSMEEEITPGKEGVKNLQQLLFPLTPRKASSDSYLCNFLLKSANAIEFEEDRLSQVVRFKDSKESIGRDLDCPLQPPRWPTECQVIEEKITHIPYVPSFPEAFYSPTGKEVQPKPIGEECGIIIYQYYPINAVNYFNRSSIGGSRYLLSTCPSPEEDCLRFESRFESGNLAKAIKITNTYYELYLRNDMYTSKHTQWFYFRITRTRKNVLYRFSIVNLSKDGSLYNEGMKLLMYSEKDAQLHSIGWRRCGDNITYFCNESITPDDPNQQQLYTLTFTLEFPHDDDAIYLAHSYPYTYSDLQNYLQELTTHPIKSTFSNLRLLCKTLAGNNVYYITITSPQVTGDKKSAIVITARVHPGETPSSWMMKGFLDFLTGDSGPAKELRDKFIFKLVPMLNPDGVIVGNNRCSLSGRDLNRQYRTVIREAYPSIWYTKLMIRRLLEECGVAMYCDLHAHSRRHNIFIYGCENRRGAEKRLHEQIFPLMLHKNAADKFSFESCRFRVQKCKEGTGRVVMWMMGIPNSFTMEASFGGSTLSTKSEIHFHTSDYEQMGKSFCQTLLDFYDDDPRKEILRLKIINRLVKEGSNADEPTNIQLSDYSSDSGVTTSGTDEEGGDNDIEEIPFIVPPPSPAIAKKPSKSKIVPQKSKNQIVFKSPPPKPRKTLPMSKANFGIYFNSQMEYFFTSDVDSSSDTDTEMIKPPTKTAKKKKKKKKQIRSLPKSKPHPVVTLPVDFSDTEIILNKKKQSISTHELISETRIRSQSWQRGTTGNQGPTVKNLLENKRSTARQLAEVQAKLLSLRNKLWFGVGDNDYLDSTTPLIWDTNSMCITNNPPLKTKKKHQKHDKDKKSKVLKKEGKEMNKEKLVKKEKSIKRQTTVDWSTPCGKVINEELKKLSKLKNFAATAKLQTLQTFTSKLSNEVSTVNKKMSCSLEKDDVKANNKKKNNSRKKGKEAKLEKTAKTVTNANLFIRKER
ncbi:cytosolic carboxypeptidase 2-like isoform X2 [Onthophagus taurus]|uniref:cytosolic carboxypeptidase 2-like isoform X2 n=1 Tax=Onthophagus taurus TaxID=166361 RepID=UPI0039BDC94E